jgi:hypothetical protein
MRPHGGSTWKESEGGEITRASASENRRVALPALLENGRGSSSEEPSMYPSEMSDPRKREWLREHESSHGSGHAMSPMSQNASVNLNIV